MSPSPVLGGNEHKIMGGSDAAASLAGLFGAAKTGGKRRRSGKKSKKGKKSRGGKKRGRKSRKSRKK